VNAAVLVPPYPTPKPPQFHIFRQIPLPRTAIVSFRTTPKAPPFPIFRQISLACIFAKRPPHLRHPHETRVGPHLYRETEIFLQFSASQHSRHPVSLTLSSPSSPRLYSSLTSSAFLTLRLFACHLPPIPRCPYSP